MDCGACYGRIPAVEALPAAVKSIGERAGFSKVGFVGGLLKIRRLSYGFQGGFKLANLRSPIPDTVASAEFSKCEFRSVPTPLEPTSSAGKFLSSILQNHRHLFPFAVSEQLEALAADRDGAIARLENSMSSTESCLHGRIAEMKEEESQIAIEEVLYMLIVHKFSEIDVPMVPRLSTYMSNGRLEILAFKERELESIHGIEALDMIREHLSTIIGYRGKPDISDNWTTTPVPRLQLGRIYAASVMYGYFLKSASLRHHLDQTVTCTQYDPSLGCMFCLPFSDQRADWWEDLFPDQANTVSPTCQGSRQRNTETLCEYVMQFDCVTLQRCAKLKTKEAVNLIERHTWALFGDDEKGRDGSDEIVHATISSLRRLVLEAVAFGSFLWDVEAYVDSFYRLTEI
ncbi:UV-B-induced protein At3g17800, chloroplastic-like [Aristolochia californica]|uniref:UV-B-induced protein At3g17800, chloroplastic-like n=1 Tax=Aristolochia californica TaxID=171875 RepID=UPI0035D5D1A2